MIEGRLCECPCDRGTTALSHVVEQPVARCPDDADQIGRQRGGGTRADAVHRPGRRGRSVDGGDGTTALVVRRDAIAHDPEAWAQRGEVIDEMR
jgi:hypothetical protein